MVRQGGKEREGESQKEREKQREEEKRRSREERMKGNGSEGEREWKGWGKRKASPCFRETAGTKHCLDILTCCFSSQSSVI